MSRHICLVGDSLTFGTGSTTPSTDSYGAVLARAWLPGSVVLVDGHPGGTIAQITTAMTTTTSASGNYSARLAILFSGTNDIFINASGDPATVSATMIAAMQAQAAVLTAVGFSGKSGAIIYATLPPWAPQPNGWNLTTASIYNAWVRTNANVIDFADSVQCPEWQLVSGGTDYDGVNRIAVGQTNAGHGTTPGYAAFARVAAPTILRVAATLPA